MQTKQQVLKKEYVERDKELARSQGRLERSKAACRSTIRTLKEQGRSLKGIRKGMISILFKLVGIKKQRRELKNSYDFER